MMADSASGFREMIVWQKAQDLAVQVTRLVRELRRDRAADVIGMQLLRATASVSANIAEGYGRFSDGAFRNHLSIARGSLFEAESWIDLLCRSGYVQQETQASLVSQCHEIGRLLTARMKGLEKARPSMIRDEQAIYEATDD
jgi:four helix bundle protein